MLARSARSRMLGITAALMLMAIPNTVAAQEGCKGCGPDGDHCLLGCVRGDPNSCADVCLILTNVPNPGCYQSLEGCSTYPRADGSAGVGKALLALKSPPGAGGRRVQTEKRVVRRPCDGAMVARRYSAAETQKIRVRTATLTL